jgi:hypothetical protein
MTPEIIADIVASRSATRIDRTCAIVALLIQVIEIGCGFGPEKRMIFFPTLRVKVGHSKSAKTTIKVIADIVASRSKSLRQPPVLASPRPALRAVGLGRLRPWRLASAPRPYRHLSLLWPCVIFAASAALLAACNSRHRVRPAPRWPGLRNYSAFSDNTFPA